MVLTQGEFCQFNLKSRLSLIKYKGVLLISKKINKFHEIRVFLIYDFYVEVFYNCRNKEALKAEPIGNVSLMSLYFK